MNNRIFVYICALVTVLGPWNSRAQNGLQPGYDNLEYQAAIGMCARQADTPSKEFRVPDPSGYVLTYRSPVVGLENRFDFWLNEEKRIASVNIRGTTASSTSWLANFYFPMVPAQGQFRIKDSVIAYKLARDSQAAVHSGWTLALLSMAPDIVSRIKEAYAKGYRDFLLVGHSQGAAITFLLRSYLEYLEDADFPRDIRIKTYCSAAPKPGNLYYSYDYDYITRAGWGLRVVNPLDWVPETPPALATLDDFNAVNPFDNVKGALKKQSFFVRLYGNHKYNQLSRAAHRSNRKYRKFFGGPVYKFVEKAMPGLEKPNYVSSLNYVPAGVPVILRPGASYLEKYRYDGQNVFIHHLTMPYYDLTLESDK